MADAIISAVAERVTAIIEDQIRYEVNLVRGAEKKVINLSDKLETLRDVLDDAEKRGWKERSVKKWLKKLEDVAYAMDDILDEWNYALLKHKLENASPKQKVCCSFIPTSCLCAKRVVVHRDIAIKIQNVEAKLDEILKEKDDFSFVRSDPLPEPPRFQSTSLIEVEKVVHSGDIDRNKNDIVGKLCQSGDTDHQIVAIVGMGGIGKTTLAQLVYNDSRVKDFFELMIWICVSDPFDVVGIARGIVDRVGKETIPRDCNQLELVLQKLRDSISGMKFLLVLDDVWTEKEDEWEPLKISLKKGAPTSKILVTTRNERVAKMMGTLDNNIYRPQQLSDEECWSLLHRISLSGRSEEECGKLEDAGKKIARNCNGLPLAASVLGSLLRFKNTLEEWEDVGNSEIWRLDEAEVELFPHLLLSYNELPTPLKRCFSYCAVYPKDFEIDVERLIEEWMALGYLGSVAGNSGVEQKGRDYFDHLAMRSLFQDFERSFEQIVSCKMHDIVHDFAQFLRKNNDTAEMTKRSCQICNRVLVSQAQEYRSFFWTDESPKHICDCLTSIRVFRFESSMLYVRRPQGVEKLIHLRWLDLSFHELSNSDLEIICRLYFLQTLLLKYCSLKEIPGEIENLVELRHLDLSGNGELSELPESMGSLRELRILNIEDCRNLHRLPEGIGMLENLQHLPRAFTRVSRFQVGSGFNKLGLLKNLNRLCGDLELEIHLDSMSDLEELVRDAREAELRNKIHICQLFIIFNDAQQRLLSSSSSSSSLLIEVIEALEPSHKLESLTIEGYKGSRLPHWISSPLNLIKDIKLLNISEVTSLPPMGRLPFLEALHMKYMGDLKSVGREFLGIESSSTSDDDVVAFPKLKELTFDYCPRWEEWEDIRAEEEESPAISVMPCLTELRIYSSWSLKMLPHRLLRKASSLQYLEIIRSRELQKSYGDKDGSPRRSIAQYNPHLEIRFPTSPLIRFPVFMYNM